MTGIAAFYLHDLSPFLWEFSPGIGLRWYGLAYIAAFFSGWFIYRYLSRTGWADLPEKSVGDFITWWVVLGTIIGGRLGYVLFYQPSMLMHAPLDIFKVWEGGMSAHGGMLGLVIATLLYARVHKISWLNLGDNLVVAAPVGLFFGRMANFINGELYGRVTQVPWAVQFPKELHALPDTVRAIWHTFPDLNGAGVERIAVAMDRVPGVREFLQEALHPRHPSQLYEAFLEGLVLFAILWLLRTRFRLPNGMLTGVFFIGYAIFRSFAEIFREPDSTLVAALTRGQFLSVFLCLLGTAFVAYGWKFPAYPKRK
jgi:phosphatidylglycerol:prolipoprotein diacylglycerol transferase